MFPRQPPVNHDQSSGAGILFLNVPNNEELERPIGIIQRQNALEKEQRSGPNWPDKCYSFVEQSS